MRVLKHIGLFIGSLMLAAFMWFGTVMVFGILTATQRQPVGIPGIIHSEHDGVMTFQTTSQNPGFSIVTLVTGVLIYLLIALILRRAARRRSTRQLQFPSAPSGMA